MKRSVRTPSRPRLLLGEDEPALRDLLVEALTEEGFDVVAAVDGAEVLELFSTRGPFDALVLDDDMPGLKGRQALVRLRSAGTPVPAVICSGRLEMGRDECARLGVRSVLRKPCPLASLVSAIRAALEDRPSGQPSVR